MQDARKVASGQSQYSVSGWHCLLITAYCLLLFSCKTTQRTSGTSLSTGSNTTETTFSSDTFHGVDGTFQSLTKTITRSTPTVVMVNGREEVVTETTTETQTAVVSTQKDSTRTQINATFQATQDTTAFLDTLSRATEGMEVIPDIVEGVSKGIFSAIFGKTGKFIVSLILLVIFVILLKLVFKKKKGGQ